MLLSTVDLLVVVVDIVVKVGSNVVLLLALVVVVEVVLNVDVVDPPTVRSTKINISKE